ncbi:hypothetical protein RUM44_000293 [Polyplax serrata]|uniref:Enoyl reductase (ER) domain-containing protein n=1 Tax=Polyplax serrata TaxID=468196 RepID=A0ABR1B525_POLSC
MTSVFRVFCNFGRSVRKIGFHDSQIRHRSVKAAVLKEFKSPLIIDEVKQSKLKGHEIRIKVQYCSVNPSDVEIVKGYHEYKPKLPFVPGYEMAGEVLEVGKEAKLEGFNVGDKVIGLNKEACGGLSEECIVVSKDCYHVPQGISLKDCSALLDGYITAVLGLIRRGKLEEGETVLVTAAGGGIGLAAVDLAANVYKAKVIAVCSSEDKAALVREKGAFMALKYDDHLAKEVNKMTGGKGVKVVFDATGDKVFDSALHCVANEGRMVLASNAARNIKHFNPSLLLPKAISVTGVSPWHYRINDFDTYKSCVEDVIDMAEQELISPHVSEEFELQNVNSAFEYLLDAKCTGKVVVKVE